MSAYETHRLSSVDRSLGQLISFTGLILLATQAFYIFEPAAPVQPWWRALSLVAPGLMILTAALGRILPLSLLKLLWIAIPAFGFLATLLSFAAYTGDSPSTFLSWEWRLAGPYLSFVVLWLPPKVAVAVGVATGFFPAVSGLLRYQHVPTATAELIPVALTNFGFAVLFIGIRSGMNRFRVAKLRASEAEAWSKAARATATAQAQFAQIVHDHVLGTLSSALRFDGIPPLALQTAAKEALSALEKGLSPSPAAVENPTITDLAAALVKLRDDFGWSGDVRVESPDNLIPADAAEAIIGAASEALRNAQTHAGKVAPGEIDAVLKPSAISLTVRDRGSGFDPENLSPERLGIRGSILGRMESVRGGAAQIWSGQGGGTEVRLQWSL